MTCEEALLQYGLPAESRHRESILGLLDAERSKAGGGEGDPDLIRCLCAQLLSIGDVRDSLAIWRVKATNFDLMCGLDIQFICGAGIDRTRDHLIATDTAESREALKYLDECRAAGDFVDWEPAQWVAYYRRYFGI